MYVYKPQYCHFVRTVQILTHIHDKHDPPRNKYTCIQLISENYT